MSPDVCQHTLVPIRTADSPSRQERSRRVRYTGYDSCKAVSNQKALMRRVISRASLDILFSQHVHLPIHPTPTICHNLDAIRFALRSSKYTPTETSTLQPQVSPPPPLSTKVVSLPTPETSTTFTISQNNPAKNSSLSKMKNIYLEKTHSSTC